MMGGDDDIDVCYLMIYLDDEGDSNDMHWWPTLFWKVRYLSIVVLMV